MSEFSSEGYDSFPSIYADSKMIHEFATTDDRILQDRLSTYTQFLKRDDLMPRARAESERLVTHLMFEICYRQGYFEWEEVA